MKINKDNKSYLIDLEDEFGQLKISIKNGIQKMCVIRDVEDTDGNSYSKKIIEYEFKKRPYYNHYLPGSISYRIDKRDIKKITEWTKSGKKEITNKKE